MREIGPGPRRTRESIWRGAARSPDDAIALNRLGLALAEFGSLFRKGLLLSSPVTWNGPGTRDSIISHTAAREGNPNDISGLESRYLHSIPHFLELIPALNIYVLIIHPWMDPPVGRPKVALEMEDSPASAVIMTLPMMALGGVISTSLRVNIRLL
ncbi:MAG: hypothetical protein V2J25_10185 [Desulfatiglans sp.]|nr:hypothetical protein [Desulfatiglans sp.]